MNALQLNESLVLLNKAQHNLDFEDYVNIWGRELGVHIWRQEGSDLLRIWNSGLTVEQQDEFITYVLKKFEK